MKRYVIAAIFVFCLTMTLFLAVPTRSIPTVGEYDSWADTNDDGKIDIKDVSYVARLFGTSGSSAKPVTINNNWTEGGFSFSLAPNEVTQNFTITTAGFKTITISLNVSGFGLYSCEIQIFIGYLSGNDIIDKRVETSQLYIHGPPWDYPWYRNLHEPIFRQSYEVTSPQMMFCIWNNSTWNPSGSLYYYLST